MTLLVLSAEDVEKLLPMRTAIEIVAKAMRATARGQTLQPPRWIVPLPCGSGNGLGLMPGWMASPHCFGAKVTAVFPGNHGSELSSHQGAILLFEGERGRPLAVVNGGSVTAIRTAAASAVATRELARADSAVLAILGYGEQATRHLEAVLAIRDIRSVRVWGRSPERAAAFAAAQSALHNVPVSAGPSVETVVDGADIICSTTGATEPILEGKWLSPGSHLNVVGSSVATAREIDVQAVTRSRFYTDYKPSVLLQGGEYLAAAAEGAVDESFIIGDIGHVLEGSVSGRLSPLDITLYKSLGIPAQDLATAHYLYELALAGCHGSAVQY